MLVMLVLGTATMALTTQAAVLSNSSRFSSLSLVERVNRLLFAAQRINYAFNAFWYLSAFPLITLTTVVYLKVRRARTSDTVTKAMLFLVIPMYTVMLLFDIIYTILISPGGIKLDSFQSIMTFEKMTVGTDIMYNLSFITISLVLLLLGLRRSRKQWDLRKGPAGGEFVKLQNLGQDIRLRNSRLSGVKDMEQPQPEP